MLSTSRFLGHLGNVCLAPQLPLFFFGLEHAHVLMVELAVAFTETAVLAVDDKKEQRITAATALATILMVV